MKGEASRVQVLVKTNYEGMKYYEFIRGEHGLVYLTVLLKINRLSVFGFLFI